MSQCSVSGEPSRLCSPMLHITVADVELSFDWSDQQKIQAHYHPSCQRVSGNQVIVMHNGNSVLLFS